MGADRTVLPLADEIQVDFNNSAAICIHILCRFYRWLHILDGLLLEEEISIRFHDRVLLEIGR